MADPRAVANLIDVEASKVEHWIDAGILLPNRSGTDIDLPQSEITIARMLKASVNRRVLGDDAMQFLAGYFRLALNREEHSADERETIETAQSGGNAFLAIRMVEAPSRPGGHSITTSGHSDRDSAALWLRESDKDARALVLAIVDLAAALKPLKARRS